MRPPAGLRWLLLGLLPLSSLPGGAGLAAHAEEEEAALSAPRCKALREMAFIKSSESDCYCFHQNTQMKWNSLWSTVQVKITSPGLLHVVYITGRHNCQYPETIISFVKCMFQNFWAPREAHEISITIHPCGQTVCFSVKPVTRTLTYTLRVSRNLMDFNLFLLFVAGLLLFFYAKTFSQSPLFYYLSGTLLGLLMTSVFVLLLARRFIPKYSTFGALMVACWFASIYILSQWTEDLKWLWSESRLYLLGYALTVGLSSFALCYKHGPLVDARSQSLVAGALQLLSLVLIYCGISVPAYACTAVVLVSCSALLHYLMKALHSVTWKMKSWFASKKPVIRLLTAEEYREQADAQTAIALEELRQACRRPHFPAWLAVSRLGAPKKFADFVLGANHLSPEEIHLHEEQFGLGSVFLEEQLFNGRTT
ncbi:nuclear envelope integral membrane protein 2 [Tenrec ecaudatus]|uniref:nuclear envelope integral membrane protein 2 n=1 Tax=Tenrec ecaudatus TaxID=94439 RepID=UPI003F5962E9